MGGVPNRHFGNRFRDPVFHRRKVSRIAPLAIMS